MAALHDPVGHTLGKWKIVRLIGKGAFGTVYEAHHLSIERRAALKILKADMADNPDFRRRFLNEASAASRAEHENIVQVFDVGEVDNTLYVVMELLSGVTLSNVLRGGSMNEDRTLRLGIQVAGALAATHRVGVIHRDLKPDNIMLVPHDNNPEFVKVLDFGIAKLFDAGPLTQKGTVMGTPPYMSPEQWKCWDVDGRVDIYALGVILYQCLTGALPFSARDQYAWQVAHLFQPVPDPRQRALVSDKLATLVLRMMAKERDERPEDMKEVLTRLRGCAPATPVKEGRRAVRPPLGPDATNPDPSPIPGTPTVSENPPTLLPDTEPERGPTVPTRRRAWRLTVLAGAPLAAVLVALLWPRPPVKPGLNEPEKLPKPGLIRRLLADPIVVGVNDFGGAYPLLLANDGLKPGPNSLFQKADLDVEIRWIPDSKKRIEAYEHGDFQVMLLSHDYMARQALEYEAKKNPDLKIQSFLLVDWSRGNMGIISTPEIQKIADLRDARIGTSRNSGTHYLLLKLLGQNGLNPQEIKQINGKLVFKPTRETATAFIDRSVDAAVLWEPYLSDALKKRKGHVLVTTATETNVIADVLYARKTFLDKRKQDIPLFLSCFFDAVRQLRDNPDAMDRTIGLAVREFNKSPQEVYKTLLKIKPAAFADNRDFFGLEGGDCAYDRLYKEAVGLSMSEEPQKVDPPSAPSTKYLEALESIKPKYRAEGDPIEDFAFNSPPDREKALITNTLSINYATNQINLDPKSKELVDRFAQKLLEVKNAWVLVEGHTDNVGSRKKNIDLSEQRATAVVEYLVEKHQVDKRRCLPSGKGPDIPVKDNNTEEGRRYNNTEEGRRQNRRTEFRIIKTDSAAETLPAPYLQVVRPHQRDLESCYKAHQADLTGQGHRVVLRMVVDSQGEVQRPHVVESDFYAPSVEGCLREAAKKWVFPTPDDGQPRVIDYQAELAP